MLKQVTETPVGDSLNLSGGKIKIKTRATFQTMRNRNKDFWSKSLNKKINLVKRVIEPIDWTKKYFNTRELCKWLNLNKGIIINIVVSIKD